MKTDLVKSLAELCLELDEMNSGRIPLSSQRHHEIVEGIVQIGKSVGSKEAMQELADRASEVFPKVLFMTNPLWHDINDWRF